jgi:putative ABC transport system permease protein
MLLDLIQDLRFALRTWKQRPAFALMAVLTLALGTGAAVAVFSIVDGALLHRLPYRDPGRLVAVWDRGLHDKSLVKLFPSYADFDAIRRQATSFESVSAATWAAGSQRVATIHGVSRQVLAELSSASFFQTLGVSAEFGRTFQPDDERRACTVVLAHPFWTRFLDADPAIVGRTLTIDQKPCAVIGIMPASFGFYPRQASMWMLMSPELEPKRETLLVGIFARLKPGVTIAQAQAEAASIHSALHASDRLERDIEPETNDLQGEFIFLAGRNLRITFLVLFAAVGGLLLIACLNVASLLLARLTERQRELAVRAALGSGKGRLIRQVLAEGLMLAAAGVCAGVLLAGAAIRYFLAVKPVELPVGSNIGINLLVLLFSGALCIATTLIFGLLPALRVSGADLNLSLGAAGRGFIRDLAGSRLSKALVAVEVAVSFVLLIGAGLLMTSALRMGSEPLGFSPDRIETIGVALPMPQFAEPDSRVRFFDTLLGNLNTLPGVSRAALASKFPPYIGGNQKIEIEGVSGLPADAPNDVGADAVTPGYFELLETPLLQGRAFDAQDRSDATPVAIVNQALVREYFGSADPLGRRIRLAGGRMPWLTIVGVTGDLKHTELMNEMSWVATPILYRPLTQEPRASVQAAVRALPGSPAAGTRMQKQIAALSSGVPVADAESLSQSLQQLLAYPRFRATVLSGFAAGALLLASIGLYGVLSQLVTSRTAEFGVRRAVGAQTSHLLLLIFRQGGIPVLAGLAGGVLLSLAVRRGLASLLFGIQAADPAILAGASAALLFAAFLAIMLPARRAALVDPMRALRED